MMFFFIRGDYFAVGMRICGPSPNFLVPGEGYNLWVVYLIWLAIVISLYPVCKWYDNYKTTHKEKWWLSYL
jgi:hypothetical protein